ncbi:MAG: DUF4351 domain-containing protein, partial [Planctomycetaceae bacterium]|nr:DUF4351 domain-containing protein [Planctomycetaceae bacterium]
NVKTFVEKEGVKVMSLSAFDQLIEEGIEKGIEQGIEKGIEQGIEQGIEKGIEQGIEKGIEQGIKQAILRTLSKRFKGVPSKIEKRILSIADLEKLEELADFAYDCVTLGEFEKALK